MSLRPGAARIAHRRQGRIAAKRTGARRRKTAVSSFLERPECEPTNGQVFWLPDQATGRTFPSRDIAKANYETVAICGFRPRLQRRDRNGIAPFSLFFPRNAEFRETPMSQAIVASTSAMSTRGEGLKDEGGRMKDEPNKGGRQPRV
jgi:hypothetical protein